MKLVMKRIFCHGKNRSKIHVSLFVEYGYEGSMYSDTLSLTYDSTTNNTYITARIDQPGTGTIVNRIIDILTRMGIKEETKKTSPVEIFRKLGHHLGLEYDESKVIEVMSQFKKP